MDCNACREQMMDVLYGEDLGAGESFQFFEHLDECPVCRGEYMDFLKTRTLLSEWEEPDGIEGTRLPALAAPQFQSSGWGLRRGWRALQTAAALFLILVGSVSILQSMGLWGSERMMVSKEQLLETVNDMIVIRQAEERKIIGQAMVNFADQMMLDQKSAMQSMADQLQTLERRYLDNLEENNEHLQVLLKRSE